MLIKSLSPERRGPISRIGRSFISSTALAGLISINFFHIATLAREGGDRPATYMNPLDLEYRFALKGHKFAKGHSAREAADPTILMHDDEYWLFASKTGGYWHSKDLVHWTFVKPLSFPTEDYAPTVAVVDGTWLLATSFGTALYATSDPRKGDWKKIADIPAVPDPDLYLDDDGRLYLYSGSSSDQPIMGVELDRSNGFVPKGASKPLIAALDPVRHGWEAYRPFDSDAQIRASSTPPWMEAPWMTKHKEQYYLQYAAPGTELPTYADGVYVASAPLGPFHYTGYSPVSYKPSGFITSAGHSSVVKGPHASMWRATTMRISKNFDFERRLGLFPTGFVTGSSGVDELVTNTYLGDYPQLAPGLATSPLDNNLAGWMLQTLAKPATASSSQSDGHAPANAFDEDIRTWWSAATGKPGEWLQVDMGKRVRIDSVQINFADAGSTKYGHLGDAYRYRVEVSNDNRHWRTLIDRSANQRDAPHDYIQLDKPVFSRFARIVNLHTPGGAAFSVSGLRIFGNGLGKPPATPKILTVQRQSNRRLVHLSWSGSGADFYIVRYGVRPGLLNLNFQVYGATEVDLGGLNIDEKYYFAVDAVNDTSVRRGREIISVE